MPVPSTNPLFGCPLTPGEVRKATPASPYGLRIGAAGSRTFPVIGNCHEPPPADTLPVDGLYETLWYNASSSMPITGRRNSNIGPTTNRFVSFALPSEKTSVKGTPALMPNPMCCAQRPG